MSQSRHVKCNHVLSVIEATDYLNQNGYILNTHITFSEKRLAMNSDMVGLGRYDLELECDKTRCSSFLLKNYLGKWQKRHGMMINYIWCMENAPYKGVHMHILCHTPRPLIKLLRTAISKWSIGHSWTRFSSSDSLIAQGQLLRYITKNYDPDQNEDIICPVTGEVMRHTDLTDIIITQGKNITYTGIIEGKRFGMSETINDSSRKEAGHVLSKPLRDFFPPTKLTMAYEAANSNDPDAKSSDVA